MNKIHFLSFANQKYQTTLERIKKQAFTIDLFESISIYNENNIDSILKNRIEKIIQTTNNIKGFGYWCWKPYLILNKLMTINHGDILIYLDAGCHLNKKGKRKLLNYINLLSDENPILVFQKKELEFMEEKWTKGDTLKYFGVYENQSILKSPQILGGISIIKKNSLSINIIEKWNDAFENQFNLINDDDSLIVNKNEFIANRHDQSIFSILCKLNNVQTLPSSEIEGDEAIIRNNPILAIRDIGERLRYKKFFILRLTRIIKNPIRSLNIFLFSND